MLAGAFVLLGVFVGVVYATTDVPDPSSVQNAQTTVVYYADGTTEMARLGVDGGNRTNVDLAEVSEPAREAADGHRAVVVRVTRGTRSAPRGR